MHNAGRMLSNNTSLFHFLGPIIKSLRQRILLCTLSSMSRRMSKETICIICYFSKSTFSLSFKSFDRRILSYRIIGLFNHVGNSCLNGFSCYRCVLFYTNFQTLHHIFAELFKFLGWRVRIGFFLCAL